MEYLPIPSYITRVRTNKQTNKQTSKQHISRTIMLRNVTWVGLIAHPGRTEKEVYKILV